MQTVGEGEGICCLGNSSLGKRKLPPLKPTQMSRAIPTPRCPVPSPPLLLTPPPFRLCRLEAWCCTRGRSQKWRPARARRSSRHCRSTSTRCAGESTHPPRAPPPPHRLGQNVLPLVPSPSGVLGALTSSPPPTPLPFLPFRGAGGAHVVTVNDYLAARDAEWWVRGGGGCRVHLSSARKQDR